MTYHYYINDVEVFPKGEWSIEYQRNEGQIFFRRIFEGELTFVGADYDLITGLDCEIATFDIYCGGTVFWQGQFQYPYLLGFDDDSCTAVVTPEVVDEYSCIMNQYNNEFELSAGGVPVNPELWQCGGALLRTLPASFLLYDYIDSIINDATTLNCGLTLKSSFMWRDDFPNGTTYASTYVANNYITGAANRLEQIYVLRNTLLRGNLGGALCDGLGKWAWRDFEDLLRNAFNAYWFIDENGEFRIEHIRFFDPAFPESDYIIDYNLETIIDRGGRSFAYRRNKYEYETGRMYDQERWTWQHFEDTEGTIAHGADFEGVPLFYGAAVDQKSDYVPGEFKEKEHASPNFWADIYWAFQLLAAGTPDTIGCPGFVMLDVLTGTDVIRCEVGILSAANTENGHLSTANLQDHYHTYDRIFINGDMNSGDVTVFQTAQKHKLQESIEFPVCCDEDFAPLNRIRTELGDGEVKAAVQKKQSIEVELWHEFDC